MNRIVSGLALFLLSSSDAGAAKVKMMRSTPVDIRVGIELAAMGFEVCKCDDADIVVDRKNSSVIVTFASGAVETVALGDDNDSVRVAEVIRAKLLPPLARPSSASSARLPKATLVERSQFEFGIAPVMSVQQDDVSFDGTFRVRWLPHRRFGVGASASMPLGFRRYEAPEGTADARGYLFGAELFARIVSTSRFRLDASAGAYAAWFALAGHGQPAYLSMSQSVWTAVPFVGLDASVRLTPHWSLGFFGGVGMAMPAINVTFVGRVSALWGSGMGRMSFGPRYEF